MLLATANAADGQVAAALDEGESAAVVSVHRDGEYAFTHDLLTEAVLRDVPERQRQRLHEITARLLELRAPSSVGEIAGHYHAAGLDAEAFRYARLAAERAASVFAHDAARLSDPGNLVQPGRELGGSNLIHWGRITGQPTTPSA